MSRRRGQRSVGVALLCLLCAVSASTPPKITVHPPVETSYKVFEKVDLPCAAVGDPSPTYKWTRNGQDVVLSSEVYLTDGALTIMYPKATDEGLYQCIATSSYGIAVSVKTILKLAMMDAFATLSGPPPVREPVVGDALTLECNPPKSYPTGIIHWATTDQLSSSSQGNLKMTDSSLFTPIASDARITTDYNGYLRFANVVSEDSKNGQLYSCMVHNAKLRSFVQGDDQVVRPIAAPAGWLRIANVEAGDFQNGRLYICIQNNQLLRTFAQGGDQIIRPRPASSGGPFSKAAAKVWNSSSPNVVLVNGVARMKCIFKGFPTPQVTWTRVSGGPMPATAKILSSGMELGIQNVAYSDAGTYRCTGTNSAGSATVDIELRVQSAPVFTTPADDASPLEGDDATFRCEARGDPTPTIAWSLNGKPLSEWKADDRRMLSPDMTRIMFKNVKKDDTMVLQCNASNIHGYSFDNAILNVIWQKPSIVEAPQVQIRVVIGKSVTFRCRVFGAPRPALSWQRDGSSTALTTGVAKDGFNTTFTIESATKSDAGKYFCFAENIYGQDKAAGELIVRDRTQIADPPTDQTVNVTQTAKFPCRIIVDAAERQYLKVKWYRDGVELRTGPGTRYTVDSEHSLIISDAAVADTGSFKCGAVTDLDSAEGTAELVVKDKPDPPHSVRTSCQASEIVVTWEEGSDNNDPIREYIVMYETNISPGVLQEATRVPGRSSTSAVFDAIPFVTYTVSVIAVNGMGRSVSSGSQTCTLPPARPAKHPDGVCVDSKEASKLIIVWTPMTKADLYGDGFYYTVNYRRRDQPGAPYLQSVINDYQERQFVVDNQPTMTEYEIFVEAGNSLGKSNAQPKKMIGYSGEGKPLDRPNNLQTVSGSLNATSVVLQWEDVDRSPVRVKGYFRGYRITYWPTDDENNVQTQDVVLSDVQLCRPIDSNSVYRRRRAISSPVTNRIVDLKPYKSYSATVSVLNLGQTSDASDPVTFMTLQHIPGPVTNIRIPEKASHSLVVDWDPPAEPNGVIIKHKIIYQPADEVDSGIPPKVIDVHDPTDTRKRIKGLNPDTEYVVYVQSCTEVGCGKPVNATTGKTAPDGVPDEPIVAISTSENAMNVSWVPSGDDPVNPGEAFQVKYREKGAADDAWVVVKAQPEDSHSLVVPNLKSGQEYEVVVVALDGAKPPKETPSKTHIVRVGTEKETVVAAASSAQWVIILLALLILLILIIIILLLIRYNRGQKYAVDEKEKLYGHRPDEQDEEGFGPYARPRAPPPPSSGPMPSEVGAPESDEEDELDVYDQMDASKFNEDGSFIGQYGGRKKGYDVSGGAGPSDHQRTHALSTFV